MKKNIIVCVDDEKIVLDSLRAELKAAFGSDSVIEVAESATEALELINEYREEEIDFPVIITDYIMPEMKGDELLKEINEIFPNTYSILLTGQATTEGVANAVNWGNLFRFIGKPWDTTDLILTVKEAYKAYYKDREIEQKNFDLQLANDRLRKLDNAKSYFLGLLSHELNTPLNAIYGNAQLIKAFTEDPEIIESADYILVSSERLKRFNDISLLITQIRTEKYDLCFKKGKVSELIDLSVFNQSNCIQDKSITVIRNIIDEKFEISGDHDLLHKCVEIIINNAVKFSPNEGSVEIFDKIENNKYTLCIKDYGSPCMSFSEIELIICLNFSLQMNYCITAKASVWD